MAVLGDAGFEPQTPEELLTWIERSNVRSCFSRW